MQPSGQSTANLQLIMNAVAESLWTMQYPLTMLGAHINRTVTLIKLRSGELVIRRAVEVSEPDMQGKAQRLEITLEAPHHTLQGDFARLQQVFWNLLKNAAKFTPEGGDIRLRTRSAGAEEIEVEVTDTGIGMKAETLKKVFQPFEQADPSIAQQFGGLGLGLAIAKASVDAHGGTIRAASAGRGQGATFTVNLPVGPFSAEC